MPQRGGSPVLSGDAVVGDVNTGKTFYSDNPMSKLTGTAQLLNLDAPESNVVFANPTVRGTYSASWVKLKEIQIGAHLIIDSQIETSFGVSATGAGTRYGRVHKNTVALGTERSTDTGGTIYFTEDLVFAAGDDYQIYCKFQDLSEEIRCSEQELRGRIVHGCVANDP